ncbi:MAG: cytochrome b/b6 domain-containing protein [Bryobacteraceae bacterium]
MPDIALTHGIASSAPRVADAPRHAALVRVTHWITAACFLALLVSGIEILISHPRFYWGETGNVSMPSLFDIPIPASRGAVQTGYGYVLKDQNGWSRSLHFQAAWFAVFTALLYGVWGFVSGHFRRNLAPADLSWRAQSESYNSLQRITYLAVIFVLFPLMIWTGLAMSPAFVSAVPFAATAFGGQQSARTIHFFITLLLVAFLVGHVAMVCISGFRARMRAMITGRGAAWQEQA